VYLEGRENRRSQRREARRGLKRYLTEIATTGVKYNKEEEKGKSLGTNSNDGCKSFEKRRRRGRKNLGEKKGEPQYGSEKDATKVLGQDCGKTVKGERTTFLIALRMNAKVLKRKEVMVPKDNIA